jgi:hypothetical protein
LKKFLDKVEVSAAGEKLKGVSYSLDNNDELSVSFNSYEIAAK